MLNWTLKTYRLSQHMYDLAVLSAEADGRTVNGWVREAIATKLGVSLDDMPEEALVPTDKPGRGPYQTNMAFERASSRKGKKGIDVVVDEPNS